MIHRDRTPGEKGFTELFRNLSPGLEGYIRSMNIDCETARDIAQESFLRLYKRLDCQDPHYPGLRSYLYTIARNLVIDHYRRSAREKVVRVLEEVEVDMTFLESLEDMYIKGEVIETVNDTIDSFPSPDRDIILYCIMGKRNRIDRVKNAITTYRVRKVRTELKTRLAERLEPIIGPPPDKITGSEG